MFKRLLFTGALSVLFSAGLFAKPHHVIIVKSVAYVVVPHSANYDISSPAQLESSCWSDADHTNCTSRYIPESDLDLNFPWWTVGNVVNYNGELYYLRCVARRTSSPCKWFYPNHLFNAEIKGNHMKVETFPNVWVSYRILKHEPASVYNSQKQPAAGATAAGK